MTDEKEIPLSVVTSSANIHDINLVTDVVDNTVITRKMSKERSTRRQHLCLDKGYNSTEEERKLIRRGYVLHIPMKKKKKKREDNVGKERTKKNQLLIVKSILQGDGLSNEPTPGITDSENCLLGTRRRQRTIWDWYSSHAV